MKSFSQVLYETVANIPDANLQEATGQKVVFDHAGNDTQIKNDMQKLIKAGYPVRMLKRNGPGGGAAELEITISNSYKKDMPKIAKALGMSSSQVYEWLFEVDVEDGDLK